MKNNLNSRRKKVSVLGSTGSVGKNTLDLLNKSSDLYEVVALTANTNAELIAKQARDHKAQFVAIADEKQYPALKEALFGSKVEIGAGETGLIEAAVKTSDFVMSSIVK